LFFLFQYFQGFGYCNPRSQEKNCPFTKLFNFSSSENSELQSS